MLFRSYRRGCIFDAWTDYFKEDVWEQVMDENGVSRYFYNYPQMDLVSGRMMDLDMIRYYPEINAEEAAIQKICELVENLHDDVEVVGKVPENVSAELILREFDPEQEIYNEEERSLIKEYAVQGNALNCGILIPRKRQLPFRII